MIKLPTHERIAEQAFRVHGIADDDCAAGERFDIAIKPIVSLLRQGAEIVSHNLAHETLVLCREIQKQSLHDLPQLSEADAAMLLSSLYNGHCTSVLAKKRNNGYWRKLSEEFRDCFGQDACTFEDHNPGHDAAKSARLFLHYNGADITTVSTAADHLQEPPHKKAKQASIDGGDDTVSWKYFSEYCSIKEEQDNDDKVMGE